MTQAPMTRTIHVSTGTAAAAGSVFSSAVNTTATFGIGAEGLLAMYRHMGLDCLARDMQRLGIPTDCAQEQLLLLRRSVRHLHKLEAKVKVRCNRWGFFARHSCSTWI